MPALAYELLPVTEIDRIGPLWDRLYRYHITVSRHFSDAPVTMTFKKRLRYLDLDEKSVRVKVASEGEDIVAYCLSTVRWDRRGEVESLYVSPTHQSKGVGTRLMDDALAWMDDEHVQQVVVGVGVGNDRALRFYERYGFLPRTTLMLRRSE